MDYSIKSDLLKSLFDRGFHHQCTDIEQLDKLCNKDKIVAYIGFDCTADSLHVGSLVQIMMLRLLQKHGHKPIVLIGGGTTKVGDPSGKDESRKLLDNEKIKSNTLGIVSVFKKFLNFGDGPSDAILVDNAIWLDKLEYVPFLRDIGKHFSVNRLLGFESVRARLDRDQPLSFLEFNYMLLQSYDFIELNRRYMCSLQLGGSDQWGNIVSGIDLGRRVLKAPLFGWTAPLITTSQGVKMGKTAQGAVWLDDKKLSVYDYWQFWRNTDDADVIKFLKLFTDLPLSEINKLASLEGKDINEAKIILADNATGMCYGKEAAENAKKTASDTFVNSGLGDDLPRLIFSSNSLKTPILITQLILDLGFANSSSAARRLIEGGGVRINDKKITAVDASFSMDYFANGKQCKLAVGKKKIASLELE